MDTAPTVGDDGVAQGGPEQPGDLERPGRAEHLVRFLAEAAMRAPSVRDTQPWWFGFHGSRISLHADPRRRLDMADPEGREMLLSCGAALCTLRIAARYLGYEPEVRELPEPGQPDLLAELTIGRQVAVTDEDRALYRQIWRRRGNTGALRPDDVGAPVLSGLRESARYEGAELHVVTDPRAQAALVVLHEAAWHVLRLSPVYEAELDRWPQAAPRGQRKWADRAAAAAWGQEPANPGEPLEPGASAFVPLTPVGEAGGAPTRDAGASIHDAGMVTHDAGVVAVLTTRDDAKTDWLRAGQALQRVSLRACAYGLATAYHAEALEVPELRELVKGRLCGGRYPQLVLRLGVAVGASATAEDGASEGSPASVRSADHVVFPEPCDP
jgi:hypothetical protein